MNSQEMNKELLEEVTSLRNQNLNLIKNNKELRKKLTINNDSQKREILIDAISNMTRGDFELRTTSDYVDEYLESINCG